MSANRRDVAIRQNWLKLELWSTESGTPKLIACKARGSRALEVYDRKTYRAFLAKAEKRTPATGTRRTPGAPVAGARRSPGATVDPPDVATGRAPAADVAVGDELVSPSSRWRISPMATEGVVEPVLEEAGRIIDRLVRVPAGSKQITWRTTGKPGLMGQVEVEVDPVYPGRVRFTGGIKMNSTISFDDRLSTALHEWAHAFDMDVAPHPNGASGWATADAAEFTGFRRVAESSKAYRGWGEMGDAGFVTYLRSAPETWARAFNQWALREAYGPAHPRYRALASLDGQWKDEVDFAPIAREVEDVFRRGGWLREG